MLGMIPIIGSILDGVLDKFFTDKDEKMRVKAEMQRALEDNKADIEKAAASIVKAEIQGESAVQRTWRPHLMYLIMALLVFNGVAVPLAGAFGYPLPILEAWEAIPSQMWQLLTIGMGGYIGGRTLEKMAKTVAPAVKEFGKRKVDWREYLPDDKK